MIVTIAVANQKLQHVPLFGRQHSANPMVLSVRANPAATATPPCSGRRGSPTSHAAVWPHSATWSATGAGGAAKCLLHHRHGSTIRVVVRISSEIDDSHRVAKNRHGARCSHGEKRSWRRRNSPRYNLGAQRAAGVYIAHFDVLPSLARRVLDQGGAKQASRRRYLLSQSQE